MTEPTAPEADALEQQQTLGGRHVDADGSSPGVEAPEADAAEQSRPVVGEPGAEGEPLQPLGDEVDEADYAEQIRVVPDEEDEYR